MATKASAKPAKVAKKAVAKKTTVKRAAAKPTLLSGGNPQIAKADGDAPVQAYIAAMPGWTHDVGRRLDALIVRTIPNVQKGMKWNSPFYGIAGEGWFLSFHTFAKYVKVAFFRGRSLRPLPPEGSEQMEVRYLHIYEDGKYDEKQLADWIRQASKLPGWDPSAGKSTTLTKKKASPAVDATPAKKTAKKATDSPGDWRVAMLDRLRALIQQADPEVVEERKWAKASTPEGVPTWSHDGIICTGETYKSIVKLTFAKGASLPDPSGLFNASLDGGTRRAIDFHEGDKLNERALKALVKAAVKLNVSGRAKK